MQLSGEQTGIEMVEDVMDTFNCLKPAGPAVSQSDVLRWAMLSPV